jgi:hypothetical protein
MLPNTQRIYYQALGFDQVYAPPGRVLQRFAEPALAGATSLRLADQGRALDISEHLENAPLGEVVIQVGCSSRAPKWE